MNNNDAKKNISALQDFMKKEGISYFYISSFDPFLNEYVPLDNCRRYFVTGFRGSVAEVLVPATGKVNLYVDGRYHEQADNQVDASLVNVVKVKDFSNTNTLLSDLADLKAKDIAIEGDRTPLSFFNSLEKSFTVKSYLNAELDQVIPMPGTEKPGKIEKLDLSLVGESTESKLGRIVENNNEAFLVTALDSLAWLANGRGYHLPHMSSFMGKGLALRNKLYIFIEAGIPVDDAFAKEGIVEFVEANSSNFSLKFEEILKNEKVKSLSFDPAMLSSGDYVICEKILGKDNLNEVPMGITPFHAIKNEVEIEQMEKSFSAAAKAIYDTIKWVKSQEDSQISELDLYNTTNEMYQKHGAKTQSFNTISGAGENGSIIHYAEPKATRKIKNNDLCLLDSGGYFESGYATDCTRTFLGGKSNEVNPKFKKMYTLVLKGFLQAQSAVFPEGTRGVVIDGLARNPMMHFGYNYAHGTGHGVGVHVHEGATGISAKVDNKLSLGNVVSVEPGVYFPGEGGVRIENVCVVEKHPDFPGFCRFKPLIYLGLEKELIDTNLLNEEETIYLNNYEKECERRGTSFA